MKLLIEHFVYAIPLSIVGDLLSPKLLWKVSIAVGETPLEGVIFGDFNAPHIIPPLQFARTSLLQ